MRALLHSMGGIPLALILFALLFHEWDPSGAASAVQNFGFDRYVAASPWRNAPDTKPDGENARPDLLYVELDSAHRAGPLGLNWPRTNIARLVDMLNEAGAKIIIFDQPFARPDPASPSFFADALAKKNVSDSITRALRDLDDPDAMLSTTLRRAKSIAAIEIDDSAAAEAPGIMEPIQYDGVPPASYLAPFGGAYSDISEYADTANGAGIISIPTKADGVVRRMPLLFSVEGRIFPSTALEALRYTFDAPIIVRSNTTTQNAWTAGSHGIEEIAVGDIRIPTTPNAEIWLHPPGPSSEVTLLGSDILDGGLGDQRLEDTLVFIGMAEAQRSNLRTVDGARLSRAQLHMLAFDQISSGHFVQRPAWAGRAEQAYIVVFGLLIWAAAAYTSLSLSAVIASIAIALPAYFGLIIFQNQLMLFDFIIPCTMLILIFVATAACQAAHAEWISHVTGASDAPPPPAPFKVRISQATHRDATVLVCSLRNIGGLAERYEGSPFAIGAIVEKAFVAIAGTVARHGGSMINRGDTMLAVWHTAQDENTNATNACECGLDLVGKLETLNAKLEKEFSYEGLSFEPITLNVGISSGSCVISQPKKRQKHRFSAFGAPIALASELCRNAERYGPAIVVDEATARLEGHQLAHLEIDAIALQANAKKVRIFALLGNAFTRANPRFREINRHHQQLFAAVRGRLWEEAAKINEACRVLPGTSKPLYQLYAHRIENRQVFGADTPTI